MRKATGIVRGAWLAVAMVLAGVAGEGRSAEKTEEIAVYREPEISERDRRFWAFVPPVSHPVPEVASDSRTTSSPIDAFLVKAMKGAGISGFAPTARPETLYRRLSFQLTGLPPASDAIDRFINDWENDPETALRKAIDVALARPEYGERWAQHWLDVARFSETDGFEHDKIRQHAWKYRDWVIDSLNRDLPYDQFLSLQIAGDQIRPDDSNAAVATGFLTGGPDMPDINLESERRHNVLNEMTGAVGAAFLGLTVECAQCHDHKSDPISQADFYRLRAVFEAFKLPKKNESLPVVFPVKAGGLGASFLYGRGDFRRPEIELPPGVPRILAPAGARTTIPEEGARRVELAEWLSRPDHPLTARVIVNRVWKHHFGAPLVGTPSDFGKLGDRPTHPELLDWLAVEFVRQGWSLKWLHREILMSRAWRQTSFLPEDAPPDQLEDWQARLATDPSNQWLSRQRRQRLDGEAIRDSLLAISGRLNSRRGGPGVRPPLPPEVTVTLLSKQWPVTEEVSEHDRRSVYLFARRNLRFPFFDVFDRPDPNQSCPQRYVSTTAPQALTLLNDQFVWEMAESSEAKLEKEHPGIDPGEIVRTAYRWGLGREADAEGERLGVEFLARHSVGEFFLALFNLSEFVYVD